MRFSFRRRIRHPFYPAVKPAPAVSAKKDALALYGAFDELSAAALTGIRAARAVFPLQHPSNPFLTESQRDTLWELFQVPIFILLLDGDGAVAAYECEAQEGLHLRDGYTAGMLFGCVETKLCECGRPGPRLMPKPEVSSAESEPAGECLAG